MFCVVAWGSCPGGPEVEPCVVGQNGIESLITDDLPKDLIGFGIKILFSFNLFFSYPLVLYPAHIVVENILYAGWAKSKRR